MRRRYLVAALAVAMWALPGSAWAVQFTLADADVMHTEAAGAFASVDAGNAPADLTADSYATGTLYHRVTVNNIPAGANTMTYQVCFVQGAERACSNNDITFGAAGEFEANQAMNTLTNYAGIDWTMAIDDVEVVAMDTAGVPVDASDMTWMDYPDYTLYYPLDVTYEAVVVANGDAFEGYPRDDVGNPAEAPSISPNGGTFEGMVSASLASGTQDAMIYYTTDGSDPDDTSTMWDGTAIEITADTTLKAVTYAAGFDPSPIAEATFTIVAQLSNGLRGRYYNGGEFGELAMTRTDPTIEFSWPEGGSPGPDVQNQFSTIWTGQVTARYSNSYTFKTVNDDGVRLWVNDRLIIDDWEFHGPEEQTGTINLTAGEPVAIWLEYFNGGGAGEVSLSWVSDEQPEEIIPDTQMIPDLPAGQPTTVTLLGGDENEIGESVTEPYVFEIGRRGNIDSAITVNLTITGDATNGTDFQMIPMSVDFAAGELSKQIPFLPQDDGEVEGDERVEIAIAEGNGYQISSPSSGAITILDNDIDTFNISGEIVYTGTESGNIVVEAFTEEQAVYEKRQVSLVNPGPFEILNVEPGAYTVIAYIDANDDEQLTDGETWGIHQDANLEPALVEIPPSATDIRINLDVAPGEDPDTAGDEGCCATIGGRNRISGGWLALALVAVVVGLRRRRR